MSIASQFGGRVRAIRQNKGLTQKEVARACQIGQGYLSRLENGEYKPQLDMVVLVAQGLRVTLAELFEGIEIVDIWETRQLEKPPYKGLG